MAYLLLANLILMTAIVAVGAGFGLRAYRKRSRSRRHSRRAGDPARDYAVRQDWRGSAGKLNYSSFVYFDVDRDGRYSLGDRPMGGIAARLANADGRHILTSRSNGNGFANFTMSLGRSSAHIARPGVYRFTVSVPPGWECTSGNAVQSRDFREIAGAPSGIGSDEMVTPVGLAPLRMLSGRAGASAATATILKAGQVLATQALDAQAAFRFRLPDEADAVLIEGAGPARRLALSPYPAEVGLLAPERTPVPHDAALETIRFDDVTPRGLRKVPSGYAGLNWFNLNAMSRDFASGSEGYVNGTVSGDHSCYTSSGHPAEFWSDRPFGFHSLMIASAWLRAEGETALIESWSGERLVARDEIHVSALTPIHYAPMLSDITRVRLSSEHYWQLVIDDLVLAR
ncbi:hypothetical protein ABUE31_06405 [Mesorhizobium sp. ZMM04-5]|uniref:SD-repeat containing protein B domain-containing protein n=1 Tax=Mesorhizobium marinum TaxID=3228790 RepID=A0ABV3QX06_9HYPH